MSEQKEDLKKAAGIIEDFINGLNKQIQEVISGSDFTDNSKVLMYPLIFNMMKNWATRQENIFVDILSKQEPLMGNKIKSILERSTDVETKPK